MSISKYLGDKFGLDPDTVEKLAVASGERGVEQLQQKYMQPASTAVPVQSLPAAAAPVEVVPPEESFDDRSVREAAESDQARARSQVSSQMATPMMGALGGSLSVSPAHWQPGMHETTIQRGMTQQEMQPVVAAETGAQKAATEAADMHLVAAKQAGEADALYAGAHALAAKQTADRIAEIDKQKTAYVDKEMATLDDLRKRSEAQIDPNLYWKEKGTLGTMLLAFSVGMNEMAALQTKSGRNISKDMVDDAIKQNIDAQMKNISNAQNASVERRSMMQQGLAAFGDQERTVLSLKLQYLDQAQKEAEVAAKKGTPASQAGYLDLISKIAKDKETTELQFADLTHTKIAERANESFVPGQVIGTGGGGMASTDHVGSKEQAGKFVPTLGVFANTEKEAVGMREHGARTQTIVGALQQAQSIFKEAAETPAWNVVKLNQLQTAIDRIKANTSVVKTVAEGQGAQSNGDRIISETANGLLNASVWAPNPIIRQRLQSVAGAIAMAQQEHRNLGAGLARGAVVPIKDKYGNVEQRGVLFGETAPVYHRPVDMSDKVQKAQGKAR
jgi:hypothetical protein